MTMTTYLQHLIALGKKTKPVQAPWVYSPTQIQMFQSCKRKWAFRYLWKFRPPPTAAQQLGTDIHNELEQYFRYQSPVESNWARQGLEGLPSPSEKIHAEGKILFPILDGAAWFTGFVDLVDATDDNPAIIDHKTTSDFKWALTEYELKTNTQMMSYAYWALFESGMFPNADMWPLPITSSRLKAWPKRATPKPLLSLQKLKPDGTNT